MDEPITSNFSRANGNLTVVYKPVRERLKEIFSRRKITRIHGIELQGTNMVIKWIKV